MSNPASRPGIAGGLPFLIRKRLYCIGLPPISGTQLLLVYSDLLEHLKSGSDYAAWSAQEKLRYIGEIVRQLGDVPQFKLEDKVGRTKIDWQNVLHWWLNPSHAPVKPTRTHVSSWHHYVSKYFQYRINWGLGSLTALAIDEAYQGQLRNISLQDWPQTQLPWIVFWLKEILVWGTLDPVAAYLLSHKIEITRTSAIETAKQYYQIYIAAKPNEMLDGSNIRKWAESLKMRTANDSEEQWHQRIDVELLRDFENQPDRQWRVLPVVKDSQISWLDPAGFPLARSQKPDKWEPDYIHKFDFLLNPLKQLVISQPYM